MCSEFHLKYSVKSKLGEGTFSEVLKCQNLSTSKEVAVKKLKKKYENVSEARNLPEMRTLESLPPHPNVLSLLEYMFDNKEGHLFMVFELMEMSLYDLIQTRKRCLAESRVKHLFYQLLKGVDHLHSNGIFHRDIKPENILIKKAVVKLADLGSVKNVHSQPPYTEYISTRWYRSPECILTTGYYGPKMDVWACGCVYYELLTSKPIFPGESEIDQLTKIHQIIGTPNTRVIMKMRQHRSKVDVKFANHPAMNLAVTLPFTSDGGREILRRMLTYDPDIRSSVHRLLEHRYFNDLRENDQTLMKHTDIFQQTRQMVTSSYYNRPNLLNSKNTKSKVKEVSKRGSWTKLGTSSWAPSTNTSKIILTSSKSRPNNKVQLTNIKKKPGQSQLKPTVRQSEGNTNSLKLPKIKINNSVIGMPTVTSKKENTIVYSLKNKPSEYNFKLRTRGILPPIPEL